ncbi:hypothetical protein VTI74DRAFT_3658 [Chaetomium olivicolor]
MSRLLWHALVARGIDNVRLEKPRIHAISAERADSGQQPGDELLDPEDSDCDPYIVAILLVMAQSHFYNKTSSRPPFSLHDVKVQVITHEGQGNASNFVVDTAVVPPEFLLRFMFPHKRPAEDSKSGLKISRTAVMLWPMLGLRERLAKALPEIAGLSGHNEPDRIRFWKPLVAPSDRGIASSVLESNTQRDPQRGMTEPGRKRKRAEEEQRPRTPKLRSGRQRVFR